jgi:hypothetical protein
VAGPLFRAHAQAADLKHRMRRVAREDLQSDKTVLDAMDAAINGFTATRGVGQAVSHLTTLAAGGFFVAGYVANQQGELAQAELLGAVGLGTAALGLTGLVVAEGAQRLQPVVVSSMWAAAADPE